MEVESTSEMSSDIPWATQGPLPRNSMRLPKNPKSRQLTCIPKTSRHYRVVKSSTSLSEIPEFDTGREAGYMMNIDWLYCIIQVKFIKGPRLI